METTKEIKNEVSNGARHAARQATQKASQAAEGLEGWADDITGRYHDVEKRARELADASYDVVKSYPIYSVLGAAAIGFLAGALMSRRN